LEIALGPGEVAGTSSSAVSLLFGDGERPDAAAVAALSREGSAFSISHESSGKGEGPLWVELLSNGLTFDFVGLAGADPAPVPARGHLFGLPEDLDSARLRAVTLQPGHHLAAGAAMPPVLRALAFLAAQLTELPGVQAVAWHPARCWSQPTYFRQAVRAWIGGGVFPAFCLAALSTAPDGGMQSEGLAQFIGQELRLEPELVGDRADAAKLAVRLLHWLYEHGPLEAVEQLPVPGGGEVRLELSGNRRFVRVWRG
jgi:hypothetical protein